ncbi:MAG: tetratricopeptide repeat protein [Bacteroides sp.]|nr:tetratricopeptide repeat protein [Bacteroides sp.]MCM1085408.1 tetratricopeptide repeat protein [Bacteroides sp.]
MQKFISTAILALIFSTVKAALPYQEAFDKGNGFYAQENYVQAIEQYQAALESGYECWEVFFNIGNAYYRSGNYPQAILYYERAAKRAPGQPEIQANLRLAESKIADRFEQMPVFFATAWWQSVVALFSADGWAIVLAVLFFLALGSLCLYFFGRGYTQKKAGFYGLSLSIVLFVAGLFASVESYRRSRQEYAVVMQVSVDAKTSPEDRSQTAFTLHEGSKVLIEDRIGNYGKVRVKNGSRAWVPMECLEII